MSHWLRFLGVAIGVLGEALAQTPIDLSVTPAWSGWSRPGRGTELEIRLRAGVPTRATLTLVAGRETVRTEVDLEPARAVRLHVPVAPAEGVALELVPAGGAPIRREVRIAQSESPLLGAGAAGADSIRLPGFATLALDANDFPRNGDAYASIDALLLDAPTMSALDQRQLAALVAHAAACGRTALVDPDPRARQVLEGAAGCGGRALVSAVSLADALQLLNASLAGPAPASISPAGLSELARPDRTTWDRALLVLAVYVGVAAFAFTFGTSIVMFLSVVAIATTLAWAALHVSQPGSRLVVWAEAEPASRTARYRAWQTFPGLARAELRVPVVAQLGAVRPCDGRAATRLEFDAASGTIVSAASDTRLFHQVALCYSGHFAVSRHIAIEPGDGVLAVRNAGALAWPPGVLLSGRNAYDLPALRAGESANVPTAGGRPVIEAAARAALSRSDGAAALWTLELASVPEAPQDAKAWLFVPIASR